MPLRTGNHTNVEDMNAAARKIMSAHRIPIVDLCEGPLPPRAVQSSQKPGSASPALGGPDRTVTDHCGDVYTDCDICRVHPCQYHYNPAGMDAQAKVIAAAFRANLKKKRAVE